MFNAIYSQIKNFSTFYNIFSLSQIKNIFVSRPLTLNFLITSECNLNCRICTAKELKNDEINIGLEDIGLFLESIKHLKPSIFIGGGEPFIRKDIFEILQSIKRCNLKMGVVTNGILLNKDKIDRLINISPQVLIFSFHGLKSLHDEMIGFKGGFDALCENMKYLISKNKKTKIIVNCVINEKNYNQLESVAQLAKDLKADYVRFEHLVFITDEEYRNQLYLCQNNSLFKEYQVFTYRHSLREPKMGKKLINIITRIEKKFGTFVRFKPYLNKAEISGWYKDGFTIRRKCLFTRHSCFIKQNGDIIPCQFFLDYKLGNIKEDRFIDVWKSQKRLFFNSTIKKGLFPGCMRCCKL